MLQLSNFVYSGMINLLPQHDLEQRRSDLLNYYTLVGGLVSVIGAIILAASLLLFDQLYRLQLAQLKDQKQAAEAQASLYLDVEKKAQTLEKQLKSAAAAQQETTHWAELLRELQKVTPANVAIEQASFNPSAPATGGTAPTKTQISGKADSRRSIGEFQVALSGSQLFKNVEIQTSTLSSGAVSFQINLDVNFDKLKGPA